MTAVTHPRIAPRRGAARATTWWGKAWVRAVEEAAYGDRELRLARGLARAGRVGSLTVAPGEVVAAVEAGDEVWSVRITLPVLDDGTAATLVELVAAESGRVAALLAGDLPLPLVEEAEEAAVELVPYGAELGAECSCASWVDPCEHALAVAYQVAWLLDGEPLVLFALRGLPRETLLARLHTLRSGGDVGVPGTGSDETLIEVDEDVEVAFEAAVRAARILTVLEESDSEAALTEALSRLL